MIYDWVVTFVWFLVLDGVHSGAAADDDREQVTWMFRQPAENHSTNPAHLIRLRPGHRHTHHPQTYVRKPWLIVLENLGYSSNVHAWLPLYESALWRTQMLLTNAGRKIPDWLCGYIQCANLQVLITWSITASVPTFGVWVWCGYDDERRPTSWGSPAYTHTEGFNKDVC